MPSYRRLDSPRRGVLLASALGLVACLGVGGSRGFAQSVPAPSPSAPPSFAQIESATTQQSYVVVEQRRFVDGAGNVVSVREELRVQANGTTSPDFELTFLGVVGESPKSPLSAKWRQTYNRSGRLFVEHGSFRIRDLVRVQQNYTLHHFGTTVRAGRSAYRTVVFPQTADKRAWIVDFDASTHLPLYVAAFDSQCRLVAEVEAEQLNVAATGQVLLAAPAATTTGVPTATHADFTTAKAALGNPSGLVEPNPGLASDYLLQKIQTRDDPLNGQQKLILTYTDGVDQFSVVQLPNASDVFGGLGVNQKGGASGLGNTIGRHRDVAIDALIFWDDGVSFFVTGKTMDRIEAVAKGVYLQALSS